MEYDLVLESQLPIMGPGLEGAEEWSLPAVERVLQGGGCGPSDPRVMVIQLPRPPMWLQDFGAKLTDSLDKGDC